MLLLNTSAEEIFFFEGERGLVVEQVRYNLENGGRMQNDIVSLMDGTCATGNYLVYLWL